MMFSIWTDKGYILGFDSAFGTPIYGYGDNVKYYDEETADRIADRIYRYHSDEDQFVNVVPREDIFTSLVND